MSSPRLLAIAAAASLAAYALVGCVVFDLNRALRGVFR